MPRAIGVERGPRKGRQRPDPFEGLAPGSHGYKITALAQHVIVLNKILYEAFSREGDLPIHEHRELMFIVYVMILERNGERPYNLSELSRLTGLNRETLRRKVGRLIDIGYVVKDEDGMRLSKDVFCSNISAHAIGRIGRAIQDVASQFRDETL